jgi:phospholipase/carboxylesterase
MLDTLDIETAPQPTAAVIWLHGLGADGRDFEPIVPELVRGGERAWRFVFPNAPIRPVTINNGMKMRAWYDIDRSIGGEGPEDAAGFRATEADVVALIAREEARGIPVARMVLGGFSQGGAVSLFTAPRLTQRLAGVLALSCYLPLRRELPGERQAANDGTPIFMAHGIADPMLPLALGSASRDILRKLGYTVEWHEYPMGHSVCVEEIADIRRFLFRVLAKEPG